MLGAQGSPYLQPNEWQLAFGYRYQRSDRHFTGSEEDTKRKKEGSEVINEINLLDFNIGYGFTKRLSGSVSVPLVFAARSEPIRDQDRAIVGRNITNGNGLGDLSLLGKFWLFDTDAHPDQNISLGLGVKFPTGDEDRRDNFKAANGSEKRQSVDQSIQPGDGGYGAIVDLNAFKLIFDRYTLYAQGTYLLNPRNTNGVETGRLRASESEMSVSDQYVARIGFAVPLVDGFSFSLGGRIEGVPVRDLLGDSDGFRRPGYAVSIEPGLNYTYKRSTFGVSVPVAVYRDRLRSIPDRKDDTHGDAAFADYVILFGCSVRLGGPDGVASGTEAPTADEIAPLSGYLPVP